MTYRLAPRVLLGVALLGGGVSAARAGDEGPGDGPDTVDAEGPPPRAVGSRAEVARAAPSDAAARLPDAPVRLARTGEIADEGIWTWIERMDGEVLSEDARDALAEAAEAALAERALSEALEGLDVPTDYYDHPRRTLEGDPLLLHQLDLADFDLPIELNEHVEHWLELLLGPLRKYTKRWLERKAAFEPLIHAEADAAGLPRDLIYLAMVESGFSPNAYSHAHAAGLWQFIPSTGRMYDLDVDFWLDERRDPVKSTRAAMEMLGSLNRMFDDWYLAMAAYNTGPARVKRAVARARRDPADPEAKVTYWDLHEQDLLHRETKGYVPKILAAAIIGKHPERYGFDDLEPHEPFQTDMVRVDDAVDVAILAECAGLDEEAFRALNPALRRFASPEGGFDAHLMPGTAASFQEALAAVPPSERRTVVLHAVRSGESLSVIASRYGVSSTSIVTANRLRDPNRLAVGQKLVIPVQGAPAERVAVVERKRTPAKPEPSAAPPPVASAPAQPAPAAEVPARYTVRSGDTLSEIAARFGLTQRELMSRNGLRDADSLRVGQTLKLAAGSTTPSASSAPAAQATSYTVRSGDTLSQIAQRHGVSQRALLAANGLRDADTLRVGQRLRIPGRSADGGTTHVVRSGESLSVIASRYGVSVRDLQRWNDLSGTTIRAGQTLVVKAR